MDGIGYLVVARCNDGQLLRGTTDDFQPDRFFFHIFDPQSQRSNRVLHDQLKALFYVKTLEGDQYYVERKAFDRDKPDHTKVWVRFRDGEELAGWTDAYDERKKGFTLFPVDPRSNIAKAWIPHAAATSVQLGADAENAASAVQKHERARKRSITPQDWDTLLAIEPADFQRMALDHRKRMQARVREPFRPDPRR
jgi:hypothetical protein